MARRLLMIGSLLTIVPSLKAALVEGSTAAAASAIQVSTTTAEHRQAPIISRITIRGTDIFDLETNVALNKFPYRTINWLHIQTREEVIRRELEFKVGDRLDAFLISETERNLRALSFVRAARIARFPQPDGTVALVVHVQDAWTTEPFLNLGGLNRIDTTTFGFQEKNVLGFGKNLEFQYESGPGSTKREYDYSDPRLLGSHWQFSAQSVKQTSGDDTNFTLERPFYSADTRYSLRGYKESANTIFPDFDNNVKVSEFEQHKHIGDVFGGIKVGGGRDVVNHAGLGYRSETERYARDSQSDPTRQIPADQDLETIYTNLETTHNHFIEATRLEKMTRIEDLNLGPSILLSPGVSPKLFTSNQTGDALTASYDESFLFKNDDLFSTHLGYSGRNEFNAPENQKYQIQGKYYWRRMDSNVLVINTRAEWGDKLDSDNLVMLGRENGLRGFKTNNFVGNKSGLLNIEDRMFFVDDVFNLLSFGGAVFYDAGTTWSQGRPVALSQVKSDVGAGLRFGLTRSSNELIVRLDFVYRLQREFSTDPHFVVAFGTGQAF